MQDSFAVDKGLRGQTVLQSVTIDWLILLCTYMLIEINLPVAREYLWLSWLAAVSPRSHLEVDASSIRACDSDVRTRWDASVHPASEQQRVAPNYNSTACSKLSHVWLTSPLTTDTSYIPIVHHAFIPSSSTWATFISWVLRWLIRSAL